MSNRQEITLVGGRPWGFSLMGGADHHSILRVGRVTPGSKSSVGGLKDGDVFISINGQMCEGLKHVEAQQLVKNTGSELVLVIERGEAVKSLPASFVRVAPPPAAISPKPTPAPKPPVARPSPRPPPAKPQPVTQEEKKERRASWYKQLMRTLKDQDEESDVYIPPTASMAQEESPKPSPSQPKQASLRRPPQPAQAKLEHAPPKQEPTTVVKPTPPPKFEVRQAPPKQVAVSVVKPTPPPPSKMDQPPPAQEPPTAKAPTPPPPEVEQEPLTDTAPTPPPVSEVEQPPPEQDSNPSPPPDVTVAVDALPLKESKEVSPVVQEVEAEYRESLEKKQEEETKINELERQIAEDLLSLQETVQQAGVQSQAVDDNPGPAASDQEPEARGEEVQVQGSPKLHSAQNEPHRATAVVVNPSVEENKLEHFHPLLVEEMSKEPVKEASPGRLEGDFSALEDLTAPGRHLPADATFQTHKAPEPEPEPVMVAKKIRIPPPAEKARAVFDFKPNSERELAFSTGDIITLTRTVDDNWLEGELDGRSGIVPVNYVELCTDDPELGAVPPPSEFAENPPCIKALYRFVPENERELAFEEGDTISLTRVVDDNWFEGILDGKRGLVPSTFVEVLVPLPGMVMQPPEEATPEEATSYLPPPSQEAGEVPQQVIGTTQEQVNDGGEGGRALTVEELQDALADMTGERHEVVFEYTATTEDEIDIVEGDTILVYEKCEDGWYLGVNERTQQFGTFPGNYVKVAL